MVLEFTGNIFLAITGIKAFARWQAYSIR